MMVDLPGRRLMLEHVPNDYFSEKDIKVLTCCVTEYSLRKHPDDHKKYLIDKGEAGYLLETFSFDVEYLQLTKRQFVSGILPPYSLAGTHPLLVNAIFKAFTEPIYQEHLLRKFPRIAGARK